MEEGTKAKKTVFVGGISDDINEQVLYEAFSTFGDILEVQIPTAPPTNSYSDNQPKHRGFGFVTFTSPGDAQDAIDNMDMNELRGRVLRVNLARPQKAPAVGMGNRAIWESEEWLRQHAKPLAESGGVGARAAIKAGLGSNSGEGSQNGDHADEGETMEE